MSQELLSVALLIIQIAAVVWLFWFCLRVIFGVRINQEGNPEARTNGGVFLLKLTGAGIRTTHDAVKGAKDVAFKVVDKITKEAQPSKRPVVLKVWKD